MKLREFRNLRNRPLHDENAWDEDSLEDYGLDLDIDKKFKVNLDLDFDKIDHISDVLGNKVDTTEPDEIEHANPETPDELNQFDDDDLDAPLHQDDDDFAIDDGSMDFEDEEGDFTQQEEDPDFQGIIRNVKGANLVYKRKQPDDTYTELWVMNSSKDLKRDSQIRRAILAGTDINPQAQASEDGKQQINMWSMGNVQFVELTSLPN